MPRASATPCPEDGETFTAFFALIDSGQGEGAGSQRAMPMIEALVRHMNFEGQLARLRSDDAVRYVLSGTALFDRSGTFSGYRGHAVRESAGRSGSAGTLRARAAAGSGRSPAT